MEVETQVHLYGHTGEVTSLFVCKPYSILISVSKDGTCILWDLNRSVRVCLFVCDEKSKVVLFATCSLCVVSQLLLCRLQALLRSKSHRPQKPGDCSVCQRDHRRHRDSLRLR